MFIDMVISYIFIFQIYNRQFHLRTVLLIFNCLVEILPKTRYYWIHPIAVFTVKLVSNRLNLPGKHGGRNFVVYSLKKPTPFVVKLRIFFLSRSQTILIFTIVQNPNKVFRSTFYKHKLDLCILFENQSTSGDYIYPL